MCVYIQIASEFLDMVRANGEDNPVYKKFNYNKDQDRSYCLDEGCKYSKEGFSGRHAGNMKKHLKRHHREVYDSVEEEANALNRVRKAEADRAPPKKKRKVDGTIVVKIDKTEVIDACVTLVTETETERSRVIIFQNTYLRKQSRSVKTYALS